MLLLYLPHFPSNVPRVEQPWTWMNSYEFDHKKVVPRRNDGCRTAIIFIVGRKIQTEKKTTDPMGCIFQSYLPCIFQRNPAMTLSRVRPGIWLKNLPVPCGLSLLPDTGGKFLWAMAPSLPPVMWTLVYMEFNDIHIYIYIYIYVWIWIWWWWWWWRRRRRWW